MFGSSLISAFFPTDSKNLKLKNVLNNGSMYHNQMSELTVQECTFQDNIRNDINLITKDVVEILCDKFRDSLTEVQEHTKLFQHTSEEKRKALKAMAKSKDKANQTTNIFLKGIGLIPDKDDRRPIPKKRGKRDFDSDSDSDDDTVEHRSMIRTIEPVTTHCRAAVMGLQLDSSSDEEYYDDDSGDESDMNYGRSRSSNLRSKKSSELTISDIRKKEGNKSRRTVRERLNESHFTREGVSTVEVWVRSVFGGSKKNGLDSTGHSKATNFLISSTFSDLVESSKNSFTGFMLASPEEFITLWNAMIYNHELSEFMKHNTPLEIRNSILNHNTEALRIVETLFNAETFTMISNLSEIFESEINSIIVIAAHDILSVQFFTFIKAMYNVITCLSDSRLIKSAYRSCDSMYIEADKNGGLINDRTHFSEHVTDLTKAMHDFFEAASRYRTGMRSMATSALNRIASRCAPLSLHKYLGRQINIS